MNPDFEQRLHRPDPPMPGVEPDPGPPDPDDMPKPYRQPAGDAPKHAPPEREPPAYASRAGAVRLARTTGAR